MQNIPHVRVTARCELVVELSTVVVGGVIPEWTTIFLTAAGMIVVVVVVVVVVLQNGTVVERVVVVVVACIGFGKTSPIGNKVFRWDLWRGVGRAGCQC